MWSYVRAEAVLLQLMVTGASCFDNLVNEQGLSGIADMGADPHMSAWTASKAIDGNTSQNYLSNSCAITNVERNHNSSIWWKVWLKQQFNVAYLEIYFRSDTYTRQAGFSVYTFIPETFYPLRDPKHLVYHQDPTSGCPTSVMNVTVNNVTQGIVFINTRPPGYTSSCLYDNVMYTAIEICEIRVMGCDSDKFSHGCKQLCPYKCKNQHCDAFNGSCIHGCSDPNALTIDCIVCPNGKFISNKACADCPGHCKNEAPCNKLTRMCDNGCAYHWNGSFCNFLICPDHYYSSNCTTACGHCINNDVCDAVTGTCPNGCQNHWQGERCDVCNEGYYGKICDSSCGHCVNGEMCDKNNGTCYNGCVPNYQQPKCKECVSHKYGPNCGYDCGHYKDGKSCVAENGVCTEGCDSGWIGDLCVTAKLNAPEFDKEKNKLTTTGVAIITGLSTMFAISLFINFFMTRHIMKHKTNRHRTDPPVPENEKSPQTYVDLSAVDDNHAYSTLDSTVSETPYNMIGNSHNTI